MLSIRQPAVADARRRATRLDGRVDVGEDLVFHRSLELDFADAYDRLLRATESLDVSRELIPTPATTTRRKSPRTRTRS